MPRYVPPVHSPLPLGALLTGGAAALSAAAASRASRTVADDLTRRFPKHAAVLVDSGTTALTLAVNAACTARAGPVALPAFGCFDLATAIDGAGCEFVLYDVDPDTLGPDFDSLRKAVSRGASAVIVAHYYGVAADMHAVRAIAESVGAIVIEDAAQGAGASLRSAPLGASGDLSVLSFGRGKGVTGGGGGALLVRAGAPAPRDVPTVAATSLRPAVATVAQWALARPALYWVPAALPFLALGETVYRQPELGRAIGPFSLGTLSATLPLADSEAAHRRMRAARYDEALRASRFRRPEPIPASEPGYLRYPVLLQERASNQGLSPGVRRCGISPSYPRSLADLVGFGERRQQPALPLLGARALAERLVTLPTHSLLSTRDEAAVVRWLATAPR